MPHATAGCDDEPVQPGRPSGEVTARLDAVVDRAWRRGKRSATVRVGRLRDKLWYVGQCAVAAGLAWFVASTVLGHEQAFIAPIVAVLCLGMSYGQRLRRVIDVSIGVSLGILVAEVFIGVVGAGFWQLVVIVAVAMAIALVLDGGPLLVTQAAVQGIVIATLLPDSDAAFTRWIDALVGGGVALVAATVVPTSALVLGRHQAAKVLRVISRLLGEAAVAAGTDDVERAAEALAEARRTDPLIRELRDASEDGLSAIAFRPFGRRAAAEVHRIHALIDPIDRALRATRTILRRVVVSTQRGVTTPPAYATVLSDLSLAVDVIARALAENAAPDIGRAELVRLAVLTSDLERTHDLATEVLLGQMRTAIVDLLEVTGLDVDEAHALLPPSTGRFEA